MNDKTEDVDDDLDEDLHGDDMPASDCNVEEFDCPVLLVPTSYDAKFLS